MTYLDIVDAQLPIDEGRRTRPYSDIKGKITIGIGRNLTDVGLHPDEVALMYTNDRRDADRTARELVPNFDELSDMRKAVIVNMAFNLGYMKLSGFRNMLAAIGAGNWALAAYEMKQSAWALEVGARADRLEYMMVNDALPPTP